MRIVRAFAFAGALAATMVVLHSRPSLDAAGAYPAPRFPKYLRTVTTIDPLMPSARLAARQIAGRTPLGLLKSGERLLLVVPDHQDPLVLQAVVKAMEERGVKMVVFHAWDMEGLTEPQGKQNLTALKPFLTFGGDGWREVASDRIARFVPAALYQEANPAKPPFPPKHDALTGAVAYANAHPEIDRIMQGSGGRPRTARAFGKNAPKFVGSWTYEKQSDLLSKVPEFPGDVWKLVEEKVLDAVPFMESVHMFDAEGTDVRWSVTEEDAQKHAKAAYLQGHIFLYPLQGSRGLLQAEFDKQVFPDSSGVLAGCANHTAYYPCVKTYIEHGMITRIEGGGRMGDLARIVLNAPELKSAQYPDAPRPGYWYWFEAAVGTNPKYFRPLDVLVKGGPGRINTFERNRSGVFHFGMGLETLDKEARKFCDEKNLPCDHAWHIHNYFMTYAAKLRDEDTTINIVDKGHLTPLDNAEVRALTSRYGNPDLILREEWIPGMPGINEPGDYQKDYAPDPWKHIRKSAEEIEKGTYKYMLEGYPTPEGLTRSSRSSGQ